MKPGFAQDLDPYARPLLMDAVNHQEVNLLANAAIQEFYPDGVTYKDLTDPDGGLKELRGFDSVVLALGHKSYNPFADGLKEIVKEVYVIGDAEKVGFVSGATYKAVEIATTI